MTKYCYSCANVFENNDKAYLVMPAVSTGYEEKKFICKGCLEILSNEPYEYNTDDEEFKECKQ